MSVVRPFSRDHLASIRQRVDLRAFAASFTQLKGTKEKYGACPVCNGGVDRFHVQETMWFCRQCRPFQKGRRNDVFDMVLWLNLASTFQEAVVYVEQWTGTPAVTTGTHRHAQAHYADFDHHARRVVDQAHQRIGTRAGFEAYNYLAARKITPTTIDAHHLGAATIDHRPVVVIPWYHRHKVAAVQMRFVYPVKGKRYSRWGHNGCYGKPVLYKTRQKQSDTLVITEGEFNSLTIHQETPYNSVSFGSQSLTVAAEDAIADLAQTYRRVYVWSDQEDIAYRVAGLVGPHATIIKSECDANDRLIAGTLSQVF